MDCLLLFFAKIVRQLTNYLSFKLFELEYVLLLY